MDEPRTHYQISLTARQAMGLFVVLFLALGLAFFFGLMSGLSGKAAPPGEGPLAASVTEKTPAPEAVPAIETAVPTATFAGPSRTEIGVPAEPTVPATLRPFEDASAEEGAPAPAMPAATKAPASSAKAMPAAAGKIWVQVASLQSRAEADALGSRLSRHGFPAVIVAASAPKGRVYRVRVGPYASEEQAGQAAAKLARQEKIQRPWVVPEGK